MMGIRQEILELSSLGVLPSEDDATVELLTVYQELLHSIVVPITDEEAVALVTLFGSDLCFGLGFSVMHLVETAPSWPIMKCLKNTENEWIVMLRDRLINAGYILD